jgi:acetylornithine deacetylase/succinyl-diaminopimelate desuccinylase-like protein
METGMSAEGSLAYFEKVRVTEIERLTELLRMPTISAQPAHVEDMRGCAGWLANVLASAGLESKVLSTAGHPAVFADSGPIDNAPDAPTFLVYGHYDVQPAGDLSLWDSPPFEPTVRDGVIYARGSADDKGQFMIHVAAARAWHEAGRPWPMRLKFLIEGEEEIGSPNLPALVESNREALGCQYVILSDTARHDDLTPAVTVSSRGLVYKHITVHGPRRDLHSGQYGGAVANPANVLAGLIASLHDDQHRVTIPGFYDGVQLPSRADRQMLQETGLAEEMVRSVTGVERPTGEDGYSTAERVSIRPTLDVNGMVSGYTGEGASTIIPAWAKAKVSMRLVAGQDPEAISDAFDRTLRSRCPDSARIEIESDAACAAYETPRDLAVIEDALSALEEVYGRKAVLEREGGTLPILPMFKKLLGAESLMVGFASPDCNLHSPNEFFAVKDFEMGVRSILHFLNKVANRVP